jgi:hypothetical protein
MNADALHHAQDLARRGEDEAARAAYLDILRADPTHFSALTDLGALLVASGHRKAARRVYAQAVAVHPGNPTGQTNLGHLLYQEDEPDAAEACYRAALAADPEFAPAHQGLARILSDRGENAEIHFAKGFANPVTSRPCRGADGPRVLLLVSAKLGNVATRLWIDDKTFAITEIFAEFFDPAADLPPHRLIVNAIGDADLCARDLDKAEQIARKSTAPVINAPEKVRMTGRADSARRLAAIPGLRAPRTEFLRRGDISADRAFPVLLRAPGFHTGLHFRRVESAADLRQNLAALPGERLFAIEWLDARGADGCFRKYRAIFVDGEVFPLHLAISRDWKVHYFTAAMAENPALRDEERRFLDDMPGALGAKAMGALDRLAAEVGLDFFGVDFGLSPEGELLLFEANATMNVFFPDADPIWDYRRPAVAAILMAARRTALSRATPEALCL